MFSLAKIAKQVWLTVTSDDFPQIVNGVLSFTPTLGVITKVEIWVDHMVITDEDTGDLIFNVTESLKVRVSSNHTKAEVYDDEVFNELLSEVLTMPHDLIIEA